MPNSLVRHVLGTFLTFTFLFWLAFSPDLVRAEEEPEGQSVSSLSTSSSSDSPIYLRTRFELQSFQNQTLGYSGVSYSLGLALASMGSFEFYADVPYLWGQNRGVAVQELGNPKFGLDANL